MGSEKLGAAAGAGGLSCECAQGLCRIDIPATSNIAPLSERTGGWDPFTIFSLKLHEAEERAVRRSALKEHNRTSFSRGTAEERGIKNAKHRSKGHICGPSQIYRQIDSSG
jgi:hypothetical protein